MIFYFNWFHIDLSHGHLWKFLHCELTSNPHLLRDAPSPLTFKPLRVRTPFGIYPLILYIMLLITEFGKALAHPTLVKDQPTNVKDQPTYDQHKDSMSTQLDPMAHL